MTSPSAADRPLPEQQVQLGWLELFTRHRRLIYTLLVLIYIASFNGIWRVGVDSALYRGLARSLARGDGYTFAGEHHQHAFPGMPWMLAGIEKIFGDTPVPGIILVTLMALATLWLVDRLIALRYPLWVATFVTLGLGLNFRFVRQSQELMTDVPFALGVMASLYALERLRLLPSVSLRERTTIRIGAMMGGGLLLAALTRPTFGVLAAAIVAASAVRAIRNREGRRRLDAVIVGAALLATLALFLLDPRTIGIAPLQGVYEQELVDNVRQLPLTIGAQVNAFLMQHFNEAFYSQNMWPAQGPAVAVLLLSTLFVIRRNLLWGLMIYGLVLVTLTLSTVPRYYLMVMPFIWLGWTLLWARVTVWSPRILQGPILFLALMTPLTMNLGRIAGFIRDQRQPDVAAVLRGEDRQEAFYRDFRGGIVLQHLRMARLIRENVAVKAKIIGPSAHVLSYFADRSVVGERTLFFEKKTTQLPNVLIKAGADFALFPASAYGDDDGVIREMIRKRILIPVQDIASEGALRLSTFRVVVPPAGVSWKTYRPPATTAPDGTVKRRLTTQEKIAQAAKRQRLAEREAKIRRDQKRAKLERDAKRERQEKREAAERRQRKLRREREAQEQQRRQADVAATQPAATRPASNP